MLREESRMEAVHGLCCDALAREERKEPRQEQEQQEEPERPCYSLPCD